MIIQSLDPRISRMHLVDDGVLMDEKKVLDQFETYEVFMQMKENRPYEHAGIVHAPNEDMAFLFAKEQYSRRFTCTGMWVVKTENVKITPYAEGDENVYDQVVAPGPGKGAPETYDIFHLKKRGKQHVHVGAVHASSIEDALFRARSAWGESQVLNVWMVRTADMLFVDEEDREIWSTLPEKQHRDIMSYKANDKIKKFKEDNQ